MRAGDGASRAAPSSASCCPTARSWRAPRSSARCSTQAGTQTGLAGTIKDVTAELRAEAALRRSEERFRQGFDNAPIAMALIDPETLRPRARQRCVLRHDRADREVSAACRSPRSATPTRSRRCSRACAGLVSGELGQFVTEMRYVQPDGTEVWASISVTPGPRAQRRRRRAVRADGGHHRAQGARGRAERAARRDRRAGRDPASVRKRIASSCTPSRSSTSPPARPSSASC